MDAAFQYATVPEAANMLGMTAGRVCQLLRAKELHGHKHGNVWAIPILEIHRFQKQPRTLRRPRVSDNPNR